MQNENLRLTVEIIGYSLDNSGYNDPLKDRMAVKLLQTPDTISGLAIVSMEFPGVHDANRVIRDLYQGSSEWEVPRCPVGSILVLEDCTILGDEMIAAGAFTVLETPRHSDISATPDPKDYFEGEWLRPTRDEYVVDSVEGFVNTLLKIV